MVTVDKNMSYFRQYPQISPPPPRTFPRTFQELSSTKFMFFHLLYVDTYFNTLNRLEIMLEMFHGMLFVVCHKITISLFKNTIALSSLYTSSNMEYHVSRPRFIKYYNII